MCLTRTSSIIESNIIVLDWGCLQLRVCLTQMSSFSMFNIVVLDWGVYTCVCLTLTSSLIESNKIVLDWGGGGAAVACVSNTNVLV